MAKITEAHLRKYMDEFVNERISFSRMVELLNEVAGEETECQACGGEMDAHAIKSTGLCTTCFTGNG